MEQNAAKLNVIERVWAWFEANKNQVLWGAVTVVIVAGIVSFYIWHEGEKEVLAAEDLSNTIASVASAGRGEGESAAAYLKVAAAHPGTSSGGRALLHAAVILFTQGKYAEAQTQFDRFLRAYAESPFRGQALLGVAACLDAQGKTDEAARAYNNLVASHPGDSVVAQAKFALARIYESQNKPDQALAIYEELAHADQFGSLGDEAAVRGEEMKQKLPSVVTPPTSASASTKPATFLLTTNLPTLKTNKP